MKHEDVAVGINRDTGGFAELHGGRQPRPVLDLLISDRRRGSERRAARGTAKRGGTHQIHQDGSKRHSQAALVYMDSESPTASP
jgi:hypothetical protein